MNFYEKIKSKKQFISDNNAKKLEKIYNYDSNNCK